MRQRATVLVEQDQRSPVALAALLLADCCGGVITEAAALIQLGLSETTRFRSTPTDRPKHPPGDRKLEWRAQSSRRDDLLALVRGQTGVTLAQAATRFGLKDSSSLYSVARRLQEEGLVRKAGPEPHPDDKALTG